jgi:glutaredoxin
MKDSTNRAVMRVAMRLMGSVAIGTGLSVMARGTRAIPGGGPVPPSVDNVLRFYAAWWAGSGVAMWRIATDTRKHDAVVKGIVGINLVGAAARLQSVRQSGQPHRLFRVIAVEELVLSPLVLALQRKITGTVARMAPEVEQLTVYGTSWCPDVKRSRALLDAAGVAYTYIDVEVDEQAEAAVRLLQNGNRSIPTLVWPDGTHLVEPSDDALNQQLRR